MREPRRSAARMRDVFLTFLRLGLTSFGGPVAHLGYFRREFVERRAWIDEQLFAHIVAFCSILPGPTSSQVGMIVGLVRAGPAGAFGAWLGFTLPSALALGIAGAVLTSLESSAPGTARPWLDGLLAGLTAAATAIVAQAVLALAKSQCPDPPTQTIAAGAAVTALALAGASALQWVPIAAGAAAGALIFALGRRSAAAAGGSAQAMHPIAVPRGVSLAAAVLFAALVAAVSLPTHVPGGIFLGTIVRAGSLVFGGGHVVLPLLQTLVPAGLISARDFYAGYGAAQAVPGPLFTFAAFLGSANHSPVRGPLGALVATGLIFLPSFLLVFALLPVLGALRANRAGAGALRGANAAVVGLLGALLYSPLIVGLGASIWRIGLALAVFSLVAGWKVAPWIAVLGAGAVGALAKSAGCAL